MYEKSAGMIKKPIENYSNVLQVLPHSVAQTRLIVPSIKQFQPSIILIKANSISYDTEDHQKELLDIIFKCKNDPRCVNTRIAVLVTGEQAKNIDKDWLKQLTQAQVWDIFISKEGRLNLNRIIDQLEESPKLSNINFLLKEPEDEFLEKADNPSESTKPKSNDADALKKRLGLTTGSSKDTEKPDHYKLPDKVEKAHDSAEKKPQILRTFSSAFRDDKPVKDIDDEQLDPRPKPKKKKTPVKSERKKSSIIPRLVVGAVGLVLLSSVGFFAAKAFANPNKQATVQKKKPSFKKLLSNGDYDVAAKYYPNKVDEIDNKLIESDVDDKSYFINKIYSYTKSPVAKFDDSYFSGKYETLVNTFDKAQKHNVSTLSEDNLSDKRRLMLAYSCMKIGKFDDAREYSEPLNSDAFNKRIKVYEKFYKANQILKDQLLNKKVSDNKKDKIIKQINDNQKVLDKL